MDLAGRIADSCEFIPTNVVFLFFLERNVIDATVVCVCVCVDMSEYVCAPVVSSH